MRVIAIDGPAGSGKSTVARAVASRLGLAHLDTGAMYRSVTLAALRRGIDPGDLESVAELARETTIDVGERILVDGSDATADIRSPEVNSGVSTVAANPAVRAEMVRQQRAWAEAHEGGVVEGRDIGTVVFPEAGLKVFLTASREERARRRGDEHDVGRRDHLDSTRRASPLTAAPDALVLDTTDLSVEEVVARIVGRLEAE